MLITHCQLLSKNAQLLSDLYDKRDKLIAAPVQLPNSRPPNELIQMHKIIKRHRTRCPQCKRNESFMSGSEMRMKPLPTPLLREAHFLPTQVH